MEKIVEIRKNIKRRKKRAREKSPGWLRSQRRLQANWHVNWLVAQFYNSLVASLGRTLILRREISLLATLWRLQRRKTPWQTRCSLSHQLERLPHTRCSNMDEQPRVTTTIHYYNNYTVPRGLRQNDGAAHYAAREQKSKGASSFGGGGSCCCWRDWKDEKEWWDDAEWFCATTAEKHSPLVPFSVNW